MSASASWSSGTMPLGGWRGGEAPQLRCAFSDGTSLGPALGDVRHLMLHSGRLSRR